MTSPREHNESIEQPKQTSLCANNCGFFSNEACMGLCSKCYQEKLNRERKEDRDESDHQEERPPKHENVLKEGLTQPTSSKENSNASIAASATQPPKTKRIRCAECNKKVGLYGFKCKCGRTFCGEHRHADGHKCPFDHKKKEKEYLAQQNPVVQGDKLDRLL